MAKADSLVSMVAEREAQLDWQALLRRAGCLDWGCQAILWQTNAFELFILSHNQRKYFLIRQYFGEYTCPDLPGYAGSKRKLIPFILALQHPPTGVDDAALG